MFKPDIASPIAVGYIYRMAERSGDWYRQAERDLESAKAQKEAGFYEWACFISQQASEKALKAALQKHGADAWGHALVDLLKAIAAITEIDSGIQSSARFLDKYYIPARYPNGWASGSPSDFISEQDAIDAIGHSQNILQFSKGLLAG